MNIIYSFNKKGEEAAALNREIAAASTDTDTFIPFNHGDYIDPALHSTAVKLDYLYQQRDPRLLSLYDRFEARLNESCADAVIVANAPPYHPDYLWTLSIYKVLYSADDPGSTYLINLPYLHAYNHVFFVAPTYSRDMDMPTKMKYAGMLNADWVPISVFDFEFDSKKSEEQLFAQHRDIDIIYVGGFWRQKLPVLAAVRRAFGRRFHLHGFFRAKHNLYINVRFGYRGWVRPVSLRSRVDLYQRARIGVNIHWNEWGLGNQRLYHLPANGVMQISDCSHSLQKVFAPGREIVGYANVDELIDRLKYYLDHEQERQWIARNGYRRTVHEYRFPIVARRAAQLIREGMARIGWSRMTASRTVQPTRRSD